MLDVPSDLLDEYAAWEWREVSRHPGNSVMYRLSGSAGGGCYLKIVRLGWTPSAQAEAERTAWARGFLPVPRVLRHGVTETSGWLLTEAIDGIDATHASLRADVEGLVDRLARGLDRFHSAPADACPFQFRIADALRHVRQRLETGQIDPARDFHSEFAALTADAAVAELERTAPEAEDVVVCHGDYCVPNILLRDDAVVGFVDLGELGVADRWWDLAVATWSLGWNFGAGYEDRFLAAYGVRRDEHRLRFYRLLYDLAS